MSGHHSAGQHRLDVQVVIVARGLHLQVQALGERQDRMLAHDVGACRGTTATPPIEDKFHTHAGLPLDIILGRNALIP